MLIISLVPIFGFSALVYAGTEAAPTNVAAQVNIINGITFDSTLTVECRNRVSGVGTTSASIGRFEEHFYPAARVGLPLIF